MMTLTKRAEAYVAFAKWCRYHDVEPQRVGEVIAIYDELKKDKGSHDKMVDLAKQIYNLLESMQFTEVKLDWRSLRSLTFRDRYDDMCRLPEII